MANSTLWGHHYCRDDESHAVTSISYREGTTFSPKEHDRSRHVCFSFSPGYESKGQCSCTYVVRTNMDTETDYGGKLGSLDNQEMGI